MKKYIVQFAVPLFVGGLLFSAGCSQEDKPAGGTAEQIGREIDKAVQEAGKEMKEMRDEAGKKLEEAGESMQEGHKGH